MNGGVRYMNAKGWKGEKEHRKFGRRNMRVRKITSAALGATNKKTRQILLCFCLKIC